jgi:hypothetical protein
MAQTDLPIAHRTVHANGIDIHLVEAGEGPPVILLHGFPELWSSWRLQFAPLARQKLSVSASPTSKPITSRRPLVDPVGDHQGLVAHPARFANPFDLGVQPQLRVGTGQRPLAEHGHLLVQAATQPAHGVLGHAAQAELLHQPVDLSGGNAVDICLLHHRASACSARRRGSKKPGNYDPFRSLGMASSSSPTLVSQRRGR